MKEPSKTEPAALENERAELLRRIAGGLDTPMIVLGFIWLALLVVELIWGLNPLLQVSGTIIWIIFILDFVLEFTIAPRKWDYLKGNWLTAISLVLPALSIFRIVRALRIFRVARAARGVRLVRVISSLNRGMRALGASMGRRGFGYVAALTLVVALAGAAGMYAFENNQTDGRGLKNFPAALWWTAMILTTMGSDYWPQTAEGRVLCLFLALYAFGVFGYVTASLATFFVGRDASDEHAEVASAKSVAALHNEIAGLREEIRALSRRN